MKSSLASAEKEEQRASAICRKNILCWQKWGNQALPKSAQSSLVCQRTHEELSLPADTGRVQVQCRVNDDYDSEDLESLAGSEIVDPQVLRDMLSHMDEGGEDARAAAR